MRTMTFGHPGDDGLGDRLLDAVLAGAKTATSSLAVEYLSGEPLPRVGDRLALTDHDGRTYGEVETTQVRIVPLDQVGDDVALAEGEGYRDAAGWRAEHERFWAEVAQLVRVESGDPDWALRPGEPVVVHWFRLVSRSRGRGREGDGAVLAAGGSRAPEGRPDRHTYAGAVAVSELFDPAEWQDVPGFEGLTDVTYHHSRDGRIARVAFDRPEVRNAFRPRTVDELSGALEHARTDPRIGVVLLTGNGPSPKDGGWAFSSGGDQRIRGRDGYRYEGGDDRAAGAGAAAGRGRLHILEVQRLIRFSPKVVIALVPGWAAGGGHSLHVVCDLTIASAEHARFKQTDADVGSFDAGYGSAYFARQVGQKFAREVFFLAQEYDAERALAAGAVNAVVPHAELERTGIAWARTILGKSPTAVRMLKFALNAVDEGIVGQQVFAGEATRLAYGTDEAVEGRDAFLEHREPDWSRFPWAY